jgi:hypothetical protein
MNDWKKEGISINAGNVQYLAKGNGAGYQELQNNAKLIAAAPEMLEALQQLKTNINAVDWHNSKTEGAARIDNISLKKIYDLVDSLENNQDENRGIVTPPETNGQNELENIKAGDILSCSWGYDQTNVDFYQVIKTTAKTATVQEIDKKNKYTGDMSGKGESMKGYKMIEQISKIWNGAEVDNVQVDAEFGNVTATVDGVRNMDCGFIEEILNIQNEYRNL